MEGERGGDDHTKPQVGVVGAQKPSTTAINE